MRRFYSSIILGTLLLSLFGCAKTAPKVAVPTDGRRTKLALQAQERIGEFAKATGELRGLAWAELDRSDEGWKAEAAIAIRRPDKFRIDAMDSIADVWAKIGSDGREMWLYVPGKKKLYKGRASEKNMKRLASFSFKPRDLISVLAGSPPLSEGAELVQVGPSSERHLVDLASGLHLWLEQGRKRRVARCAKPSEEGEGFDYEVAFSDYRRVGGIDYPFSITAVFPRNDVRLRLEYRDVEFGLGVDDAAFAPPSRRRGKTVKLSDGR